MTLSALIARFAFNLKSSPVWLPKIYRIHGEDLRDLQDFAEARGVTITPEIDMPGHAGSLTAFWPELRNPTGLLGKDKLDVTQSKDG